MIKVYRGECPSELTQDVKDELTRLFEEDRHKEVWNSSKIKKPVKEALMKMTHDKCIYCECMLGIESKDVTIDHFSPKSADSDRVVEWTNLVPSCLRCNRKKLKDVSTIVNPCENEPKEYIGLYNTQRFRLKGIDSAGIGKNTITTVGLNDIERVMTVRLKEWENIRKQLEQIQEDITEAGCKPRYFRRLRDLMELCTEENSYSAVKAANMLHDEVYLELKQTLIDHGGWSRYHRELEEEMKKIELVLV